MPHPDYSLIRNLDAPYDGPRIVGGEFETTVYVWDWLSRKRISDFETPLDSGARRLAINPRGDRCAVGSYRFGGLACYATDSGEVVYLRGDLKKLQYVRYSPDGERLFCGSEAGPLRVLDAETGADLTEYPSIERAYDGPYQPVVLLSKRRSETVELRAVGGPRIATLPRETFAILDTAFGPDRFCISESGGPVRCFDTEAGRELWRHVPRPGRHVLRLGYAQEAMAFFGVEWPYVNGGAKRLLRFDRETGRSTLVTKIEKPSATEVFCCRGSALLTSEGSVIDVATGESKEAFRFPAPKDDA